MAQIIPAILEEDFKEIKKKLAAVEGLCEWAQLDVADGLFAPNYSWNCPADLKKLDGKIKLEVHLMSEEPEQFVDEWLAIADRVLVHAEATDRLEEIIEMFNHPVVGAVPRLGLVLLAETPLSILDKYLDRVKYLQLMGIGSIGFQGQPFDERAIERISTVRAKWPDVTIAVDGGVSLENARALLRAGADNLVIGSAIWESAEPTAAIKKFNKLCSTTTK